MFIQKKKKSKIICQTPFYESIKIRAESPSHAKQRPREYSVTLTTLMLLGIKCIASYDKSYFTCHNLLSKVTRVPHSTLLL